MALGTDRNRTGVAGVKFCEKKETDKKLPFGVSFLSQSELRLPLLQGE